MHPSSRHIPKLLERLGITRGGQRVGESHVGDNAWESHVGDNAKAFVEQLSLPPAMPAIAHIQPFDILLLLIFVLTTFL